MSKFSKDEKGLFQIIIEPPQFNWQSMVTRMVLKGIPDPTSRAPEKTRPFPLARLIEEKINHTGYRTYIRLMIGAHTNQAALSQLTNLAGAFGAFALGEGNRFILRRPRWYSKKIAFDRLVKREKNHFPRHQILNTEELSTIWHPPGKVLSGIKNISWGRSLLGEPPPNLPVAADLQEDEKKEVNFFAKAEFKNQLTTFGIKRDDRRKHVYIIGKTGTGKSTLIANMAINDMRNREGVAVIDPHGDLSETLLDYVPSYRINDVAYLDPSDFHHPFHLNPLEVPNETYKELVSSGIVSIFHKLYYYSWGPRLEYILRNTILTLLSVPDSTLLQVPELLTDDAYRGKIVDKMNDTVLRNFWKHEFDKMNDKFKTEAIAPILNKV